MIMISKPITVTCINKTKLMFITIILVRILSVCKYTTNTILMDMNIMAFLRDMI